jgi:hypothetical protein
VQISIPIYSLTGIPGCKQYLNASSSREINHKMFFIFPDILKECPICHRPNCAIWKGYYSREFDCIILAVKGRIWIRKGLCKTTHTHFSMLPDFCVPYIKWSKLFFIRLLELFILSDKSYFRSFDFDISFSSLYWMGTYLVQLLRLNADLFLTPPPASNSVFELKNYSFWPTKKILVGPEFVWSKRIIQSGNSPPI